MIPRKIIHAIEICAILASNRNIHYIRSKELASKLGLSMTSIEQIFHTLKQHHFVYSKLGPGGGYMVCGDFTKVSLWDIATIFLTPRSEVVFADWNPNKTEQYELELEKVIVDAMKKMTFRDFVEISHEDSIHKTSRFNLKPLPKTTLPRAPNSVFQLHMTF
jgi:DNA-binding IscR family transcriptional regulator